MNIENDPDAVSLTLDKVNKDKQTNNNPKSPDLSVWILGHTLYFYDIDENYTLTLYDVNDVLVYMTTISSNTSLLELPESLIGHYELRLDTDDFYYVGYIEL